MKRVVLFVVVAAIIFAVLCRIFLFGKSSSNATSGTGGARGAIPIRTVDVEWGAIKEIREFSGTVKPSYTYTIAAKVSGNLLNIKKRIGDRVNANEVVGKIDDTEYLQAYLDANALIRVRKASVDEAQTQLTHSLREKERIKELLAKGISSQAELDEVETLCASLQSRLELAKAQVAQSEATLALEKIKLTNTTLRAPQKGLIAERHTDGGALLSVNSPLLTVVGIDTVYIEIGITEKDYTRINVGQTAQIAVEAMPNKHFEGIITNASPLFLTATRTATAEIAIVNDSLLLKPGMFARIFVTVANNDSTQLIPTLSVVSRNNENFVFVLDSNNTAKMLPIHIGISNDHKTEIVFPIIDKKIITVGHHLLIDGSKVNNAVDSLQVTSREE